MVKAVFFFMIVLGIMFYPLFIYTGKNIPRQVKEKTLLFPNVKIEKGVFYIYKKTLEKKGDFQILNIYKEKYVAFDLNVNDLLKNEKYKSSKTIFNKNIITGYDICYKNKDMELNTKEAVYDKKNDLLKGGKFQLFAKNFRGFGNKFFVDSNRNLFAENITYYLKVKE